MNCAKGGGGVGGVEVVLVDDDVVEFEEVELDAVEEDRALEAEEDGGGMSGQANTYVTKRAQILAVSSWP